METFLRVFLSTTLAITILWPFPALSMTFKHKSAIYTEITTGMREATITVYTNFPEGKDVTEYIRAEYVDEKTFAGRERSLNLTKDGFMHRVNLDTGQCTKTDIRKMTEGFYKGDDPEKISKEMQQSLGLEKVGTCSGAGLNGEHLKSSFTEMCMYKNVIPLWQKTMGTESRITEIEFDVRLPKDKINLPNNVTCTKGPDMEDIRKKMRGQSDSYPQQAPDSSSDSSYDQQNQTPPDAPNMDEAMKKAQEAMKALGDMFKKK
jgi:hypothetical protein